MRTSRAKGNVWRKLEVGKRSKCHREVEQSPLERAAESLRAPDSASSRPEMAVSRSAVGSRQELDTSQKGIETAKKDVKPLGLTNGR